MEGKLSNAPAAAPVTPNAPVANSNDVMSSEQKKQNQILMIAMGILAVFVLLLIVGIVFFDDINRALFPESKTKTMSGPVTYPHPVVTILPTIDPYSSCGKSTDLEQALQNAKVACVLDLSNQNLTIVPDKIRNLTALKKVVLDNNNFSTFPSQVALMPSLEEISIKSNKITDFTDDVSRLKKLKTLDLTGNPISAAQQTAIKAKLGGSVTVKF